MHYFPIKCVAQTINMSARMCTAYMRKTALISTIHKQKVLILLLGVLAFCPQYPTGALPLDPAGGLSSPDPLKSGPPQPQKPSQAAVRTVSYQHFIAIWPCLQPFLRHSASNKGVTLKSGLGVIQSDRSAQTQLTDLAEAPVESILGNRQGQKKYSIGSRWKGNRISFRLPDPNIWTCHCL